MKRMIIVQLNLIVILKFPLVISVNYSVNVIEIGIKEYHK